MRRHRVAGLAVAAFSLILALVAAGCGGGKAAVPTTTTTAAPATSPASQSDIALEIPASGPGGFNYTQGSYLEGFEFTAKTSISVTALGAYDSNLATMPGSSTETFATVPVAVWDVTTNNEVATANVASNDPPTGIYRYATLSSPVTLNTTDTYAVVWVSLSNYYVASPVLDESDVNPAITYLGFASYGPGGLTQTTTMVEPNWFYPVAQYGNAAIGYDLSANFMLKSSTAAPTTSTSVPSTGVTLALGTNNPAQGDCTTNTSEAATAVGSVVITVTSSSFKADIQVQSGTPDTTFGIFMQQVPGGCPLQLANGGTLTTDSTGHGQADATVPLVAGATTFFVQLVPPSSSGAPEYTSDRTTISS